MGDQGRRGSRCVIKATAFVLIRAIAVFGLYIDPCKSQFYMGKGWRQVGGSNLKVGFVDICHMMTVDTSNTVVLYEHNSTIPNLLNEFPDALQVILGALKPVVAEAELGFNVTVQAGESFVHFCCIRNQSVFPSVSNTRNLESGRSFNRFMNSSINRVMTTRVIHCSDCRRMRHI